MTPPSLPAPFAQMEEIALVAHDAGGAEILSALALQHAEYAWRICAHGPAAAVFARKMKFHPFTLEAAMHGAQGLLCGTGWHSDLEWRAMQAAQQAGMPSAAFLDHWVNYRQRFTREGQTVWPSQIWVGDDDAHRLAQAMLQAEGAQQVALSLYPNPYFAEIRAQFARLKSQAPQAFADSPHLLFVSEPLAALAEREYGDPRHWGYTELEALDYLIEKLPANSHVVIRPHPSEAADKFDAYLKHPKLHIHVDSATPLYVQIAAARTVYGCNSMALVVALLAEKPVVCCIPPGGKGRVLPHREIGLLQSD
ncbi:hypothetical protein V8J88_08890 [Massilia sp. W12]|uniref:hypothetical protein n=1 Tax=Massilia sp. W12 TaxID=3126507 RepID=UPI0030CDFFE3